MFSRGFIKLLKRYKNGTLPDEVNDTMDIWFNSIRKEPVVVDSEDEIQERIWNKLQHRISADQEDEIVTKPLTGNFSRVVRIAVVLLVLLGSVFYSFEIGWLRKEANTELARGGDWVEKMNSGTSNLNIYLSDGSVIELEPGSKLAYPRNFHPGKREVQLTGNGFFDIKKDAGRPFLVYAESVLIRVLGTSFKVKTIPDAGRTEVEVLTGKVVVEKAKNPKNNTEVKDGGNRIVLTPNKKVAFFNNSEHYVTGLVDNPILLPDHEEYLKPEAFKFDETPLIDVLEKLEKAYGVEITLGNDNMLECPVTADLSTDNLFQKIEIIGAILSADYEITGSAILLTGGGCGATNLKSKP